MFKGFFKVIKSKVSNVICSDARLKSIIKNTKLRHFAIIADGNRRWTKEKGFPRGEGHRKGFIQTTPTLCTRLLDLGVHTVTVWCCSLHNLSREMDEVENFLNAFNTMINKMLPDIKSRGIRIVHLGRKDVLPDQLRVSLEVAECETKENSNGVINFAIAYSGDDEMCRAIQKYHAKESIDLITPEKIKCYLDTADQPYPCPDLIVRTAEEQRLADFMPFRTTYSELYFPKAYYPDYVGRHIANAIVAFSLRRRLFSK